MLFYSAPLCCPGFSIVSRPVLSLELRKVDRALINTKHIQLEYCITWNVCVCVYCNFVSSEMRLVILQLMLFV